MHEVQTRNSAGATLTHESIAAAFKAAEEDASIWKISWTDATTDEPNSLTSGGVCPGYLPDGRVFLSCLECCSDALVCKGSAS